MKLSDISKFILAIIFMTILLLITIKSYSQDISAYIIDSTGTITCGTPDVNNKLYEGLGQKHKPISTKELIEKYGPLEKYSHLKITGLVYQVVVQIIHLGEPEGVGSNISDAQVYSAIIGLNNDFKNQSAQGQTIWSVDTEIQFCLANEDPNGNPTNGIMRYNGCLLPITDYCTKGIDAGGPTSKQLSDAIRWDVTKYINIFTVTEINDNDGGYGIQAFAYYPQPVINLYDGIYQLFNTFGTVGTLKWYANKNTILPHEMGHVFYLLHTFEAQSCIIDGDLVADTPPTTGQGSNNLCNLRDCNNTQQIENFMDYTNQNCQCCLTEGQKQRMWTASLMPQRAQQLANTTCIMNPAQPDFLVSNDTLCIDEWVQLGSIVSNASSLQWTMNGGYYTTSTSVTAYTRYSAIGTYEIKLKWNNTDSIIKYVTVIDCPPINNIYAENHIGDSLKLRFTINKGAKLLGNSKMHGQESQSSICDVNGQLLYYSNSRQLHDSTHTLISNNLNGSNGSPGNMSSTQSLTIGYINQYFVFVTSDNNSINLGVRFYNVSNPVLQQATYSYPTCEGITAIRHGDGIRWWIIYKQKNSNNLLAYLFDGNLSTQPIVSSGHNGISNSLYCIGQIKANRQGNKVAFSENSVHTTYLYDFDRCTGQFVYDTQFQFQNQGYYGTGYGATFDHTGNYLYTTGNLFLMRWNIATGQIDTIATGGGTYSMGQLMTAPSPIDTIFVARTSMKFLSTVYGTTFTSQGPYSYSPFGINIRYGISNIVDAYNLPQVCGGVLPVDLLDFSGEYKENFILLKWVTASELNASHFIIEKLDDDWYELTWVNASGTTNFTNHYQHKDYFVQDFNYYRLSQVDYDGQTKLYDKIVAVESNKNNERIIKIYDLWSREAKSLNIEMLEPGFYIIKTDKGSYPFIKTKK